MSDEENSDPSLLSQTISPQQLEIWREALAHLRHLSNDVGRAFKMLLFLDALFSTWLLGLLAWRPLGRWTPHALALLALVGLCFAFAARYLFKRARIYYLQMLAKKSLFEEDMGFYSGRFRNSQTDLAFPWRLSPEVVEEIRADADRWVENSIRSRGTMARVQFAVCEAWLGLFALVLVISLLRMLA